MSTFAAVVTTSAPSATAVFYTVVRGTAAAPSTGTRTAMTNRRTVGGTSVWEADVTWDNSWVNPRIDFDDGATVWNAGQVIANVAQGNGAAVSFDATLGTDISSIVSQFAGGNVFLIRAYVNGDLELRKGDAYSATSGQRLQVTKPSGAQWPSTLVGWTIEFTASKNSNNDNTGTASLGPITCVHGTETGAGQSFYIDLTAAQTGLALGPWSYDVQAKNGIERNTLVSGSMRVLPEYTTG